MKPLYHDISVIMLDIMLNIMELEWAYMESGDPNLLTQIEYNGWLLEYWEGVMFSLCGHYAFDFTLLLNQ